ncbi:putative Smr domain, tetratricopeptide-like helical domain superfamily [Helianthus anomalus]
MAYTYGFCSSPSISFTQTTFTHPIIFQSRLPQLKITQISLQESVSEVTHNLNPQTSNTHQLTTDKKKNLIWVNPKSPKASTFKQKSYDSRYNSLVQVAEALNSCLPVEEDVFRVLDSKLGGELVEQDGVIVINKLSNAQTARIVLKYFQDRCELNREVVLYNVALKVFRKSKDLDGAEKVFDEMVERGVAPDNVTFSTIIGCSRLRSLPGKAVEWFEKMAAFGVEPDDVTYAVMIDCYGRVGNVDMALRLYDRSRTEKWRLDAVTFTTIIKIYGTSGNFDGCLTVFEEMKALGVKPNLVCYNTLLDAMGRAKRPWQVKSIYQQLLSSGLTPGWATYASLIRAYGKARYGDDAMIVYKEMRAKGMNLNNVLYNTLLSMCADIGFVDEAVELLDDMKSCLDCKPDSWTYSSMITIFSCCGKVVEAEAVLKEMVESGFQPNIYVLTSLIQCYGKADRTDDVVTTFGRIIELGITPDERTCGCLLNVMTQTPREELSKLTRCVHIANPKLGSLIEALLDSNIEDETFKNEASKVLSESGEDVKKAYCNCLIDLCINLDQLEKACDLLALGINLDIYTDIQSKTSTNWSLHLKSLSLGAALTALHIWINDLTKALEEGEELPPLLGINTGHGKHKYSDKGLAGALEAHLKELNAPFHEAPDKAGWFLTTKVAVKTWLEGRRDEVAVAS